MSNLIKRIQCLHQSACQALKQIKSDIKDIGDCDHSVGVCVCDLHALNETLEHDIRCIENLHPQLTRVKLDAVLRE